MTVLALLAVTTVAVAVERSAAAGVATAPAGGQSAAARIDELTATQKLDFVLAVLDARDKSLANLSYRLREEQWATHPATGERQFQSRDEYEFRRLDATLWMHLTHYAWGQSTKVATESIFSWNGKVSRGIGFPPYVGTTYHHGRIEPDEDDVYTTYRFNELLGLKVAAWGSRKGLPFADYLRQARDLGFTIAIGTEEVGGARLLKIRVDEQEGRAFKTFWLDSACGFMVVKSDHGVRAGEKQLTDRAEVTSREQVSGVWVPRRAVRRGGLAGADKETEFTFEVQDLSIGRLGKADVDVQFPVGCEVVDVTQNIGYVVQPDGRYRLIEVASLHGRKLFLPPAQNVVTQVDPSVAARYTIKPLEPLPPAQAAGLPRSTQWLRLCATVVSVVIAILWLRHAARRRRRQTPAGGSPS